MGWIIATLIGVIAMQRLRIRDDTKIILRLNELYDGALQDKWKLEQLPRLMPVARPVNERLMRMFGKEG